MVPTIRDACLPHTPKKKVSNFQVTSGSMWPTEHRHATDPARLCEPILTHNMNMQSVGYPIGIL